MRYRENADYLDGARDMLETIRPVVMNIDKGGYSVSKLLEIFGKSSYDDILDMEPEDILIIHEEYLNSLMKVGDVVISYAKGKRYLITHIEEDDDNTYYTMLSKDGTCIIKDETLINNYRKSDQHIDLSIIFDNLKEGYREEKNND